MLNIITSNPLDVRSIRDYNDNFIVVHTTAVPLAVSTLGEQQYQFDIYYQDGMELEQSTDYVSDSGFDYNFIPSVDLTEVFGQIADKIETAENRLRQTAEEADVAPDELMIAAVCDIRWNRKAVSYLNARLNERHVETNCLDLYQYYKIRKTVQLVEIIKNYLHSDFIYPEDPVQFGYALHKMIGSALG